MSQREPSPKITYGYYTRCAISLGDVICEEFPINPNFHKNPNKMPLIVLTNRELQKINTKKRNDLFYALATNFNMFIIENIVILF